MIAGEGQLFVALALAFIVTATSIFILRPFAIYTGWVDHPSARKRHNGEIPLTGGVSIFLGISAGIVYIAPVMSSFELALFITTAIIALVGAIDDRFDISARLRVLIQVVIVFAMLKFTGIYIHTLGTYSGHSLILGWWGIPLTVITVVGLLNAFNMMDGLDGLCGSMGIISIISIVLLHGMDLSNMALLLACMMGVCLVPYLAFNFGIFGKRQKIFMGDAGSMALGHIVAWSLIYASQREPASIMPATVPWLVAVPVMDTLIVMLARVLQGKSPMSPGRGHIHHILQRAGLGPRRVWLVLIAMAVALAATGKLLEGIGSTASLTLFILLLMTYAVVRIVVLKALEEDVPSSTPTVFTSHYRVERHMAAMMGRKYIVRIGENSRVDDIHSFPGGHYEAYLPGRVYGPSGMEMNVHSETKT